MTDIIESKATEHAVQLYGPMFWFLVVAVCGMLCGAVVGMRLIWTTWREERREYLIILERQAKVSGMIMEHIDYKLSDTKEWVGSSFEKVMYKQDQIIEGIQRLYK